MPCETCKSLVRFEQNRDPNCKACGYVTVIDENLEFIHLFQKYNSLLSNGMGGIDTNTIRLIFELETVDKYEFVEKLNLFYLNGKKVNKESQKKYDDMNRKFKNLQNAKRANFNGKTN